MKKSRLKIRITSWRDLFQVGLPMLVLLVAGFWLAAQFIKPAPPRQLVISTGADGGGYQRYAARYKDVLQSYGVELIERPSLGAVENLARLRDPETDVDAGFLQGGLASTAEGDRLLSLGGLFPEPLWVFYRRELSQQPLERLDQLRGRRIAIGHEGSGARQLAMELLAANGLDKSPTRLVELDGMAAARALRAGKVDVVMTVGPLRSALVWSLLYSSEVRLMSLAQAEAYTRLFPYLQQLTLARGSVDLQRDLPARDVHLLAPLATLAIREDLHPALVDLLLEALREVHGEADILQRPGEYPRAQAVDYPLSPVAERYYKSGKGFLQRNLPFWLATLVDRSLVLLVPVIALLLPLARFAPLLYGWRVRRRIFRRYGELKFIEAELDLEPMRHTREEWLQRLDAIEADAHQLTTPLAFADMVYHLRSHIELVRATILRKT